MSLTNSRLSMASCRGTSVIPTSPMANHAVGEALLHVWLAVAGKAVPHIKDFFFPHDRHLLHVAMARGAGHSLCNVNAVVEVNVLRKPVDPIPLNRLAFFKTVSHGL